MRNKRLSQKSLTTWVEQAPFVFYGRVTALGKSNLDSVEPDEKMATVHIEEVVIAPRDLGDLTGKTVTVYLHSNKGIVEGQRLTFFASSWHFGKNIGVTEIGRTGLAARDVREATINERIRQLDEMIQKRTQTAMIIISGTVIFTYRAEHAENLPGREEGVEWWEAEIWVKTVEKGRPPADLRIFYPIGGGPEWASSPKCQSGQEGIWFLRPVKQSEEEEKSRAINKQKDGERLMAYDILDYHAMSALPRIQALLWRVEE